MKNKSVGADLRVCPIYPKDIEKGEHAGSTQRSPTVNPNQNKL